MAESQDKIRHTLEAVRRYPGLLASEIAVQTPSSRRSVYRHLMRLERQGLVRAKEDQYVPGVMCRLWYPVQEKTNAVA